MFQLQTLVVFESLPKPPPPKKEVNNMHNFKNQNGRLKSKNNLIFVFYQLNQQFLQFKPSVFTLFIGPIEDLVLTGPVWFLKP